MKTGNDIIYIIVIVKLSSVGSKLEITSILFNLLMGEKII